MEKYVAALERIDLLHAKKTIDDETMIRLTGEAGAAFAATSGDVEDMASRLSMVNEEANKTIPAMSQLAQMSNDAGSLIAQGFEDAILSGQKLSEVVRALGRDLVRLVFNQMVTQRLASGIATLLGAPPIPGRAMGGPVSGGSPYVVGEQGPELFVPHASGTIVPNNKMGGGSGSGSGSVTVNYNIAAGVSRAELAPILEQERRRLKAEIPDMVRRGGGYRAAFA
jgi:phage-related minor tail protein